MNYQEIAKNYRNSQTTEDYKTGVVLIYLGKAYGWKNELRDPQHERPDAIAVDEQGRVFLAVGGNDSDGAKAWVLQ